MTSEACRSDSTAPSRASSSRTWRLNCSKRRHRASKLSQVSSEWQDIAFAFLHRQRCGAHRLLQFREKLHFRFQLRRPELVALPGTPVGPVIHLNSIARFLLPALHGYLLPCFIRETLYHGSEICFKCKIKCCIYDTDCVIQDMLVRRAFI